MSDVSVDLPQELISEIHLRLPIKSIGRSRCVSKPWLSLLTSYDFIKAHLAHHTHFAHEQNLLLRSSNWSLSSLTLDLGVNHLRKLKFFDVEVFSLVDTCNGLVLVDVRKRGQYYLINCMIKEYVKLPDSPKALCTHPSSRTHPPFRKHGFGYDSLGDDYKFVSISQCGSCAGNFVEIYSLKMRSWNRFGIPFYGLDISNRDSCLFVNGALHWIVLKSPESVVIVAFNLSSEKFEEIPAPVSENNTKLIVVGELNLIDGCLGIVVQQFNGQQTDIWLMKSYSSVESWTKLVIGHVPLCFHQDKILFHDRDGDYKWYCVQDGRVEVCLANNGNHCFDKGITYSLSLVSPHFNYHN